MLVVMGYVNTIHTNLHTNNSKGSKILILPRFYLEIVFTAFLNTFMTNYHNLKLNTGITL